MTDLKQSLSYADFSHLKVVAEVWGLPFLAPDFKAGLDQLSTSLLGSDLLVQARQMLSDQEQEALLWLDARGGKELWDHFSRRFGVIREVGAGKLEREQPYKDPVSPAESLWYRALIARGFLETDDGPREYVYIPEDLRKIVLPRLAGSQSYPAPEAFSVRKAAAREYLFQVPADAAILDHFCTSLAAARLGIDPQVHLPDVSPLQLVFLRELSRLNDLLSDQLDPSPDRIRDYFELSRGEALLQLWTSWRGAEAFQELSLLPTLKLEGNPELDPVRVRDQVLGFLQSLAPENWWSLESFLSQVKEISPDLIRKSGEYDSWFIRDAESGDYLKGFEFWDQVEGALLRFLLTGPLHWLGFLDLGLPAEDGSPLAFRLSKYSRAFLDQGQLPLQPVASEDVQIRAKGEVRVTRNVAHKTRYQIARFCEWESYKADAYLYSITPGSLTRAERQGLRVVHFLSLLKNNAGAIPPNILTALERWEKGGVQATLAQKTVLRLGSPAVLRALKKSKASRYILEQIGPTAVIVKEGSEEKIAQALVEMGFFAQIEDQSGSQT